MTQSWFGLTAALTLLGAGPAAAAIDLGAAAPFAVLGASTVTSTGDTVINGDLGLSPGASITGFPPGVVNGATHVGDALAQQARIDALAAYDALAALPVTTDLGGADLGGLDLTAGVYTFSSSAQLTGTLTLSGPGRFVFVIGSTLTTAGGAIVASTGCGGCDVYWDVGSSATLGAGTAFEGTILAVASAALNAGATIVDGRAIALNGAVTLDGATISAPGAGAPEPGVWTMMMVGFAGLGLAGARRAARRRLALARS
ncbi:uncharacterized protein DUF3494 [Roseiarcus fermentans]|uniref:Uncharacterized protein DUF3494 n=1 Tax=Roseiarcus fermentans TaxID=1473586 RepID=A0A366F3B8_9HYPH|nr:ice-binding family protein [Roseiarcus fermentans]RBP09128.1 uncharacterized protein DUF3494 [Roseiarcus fermentans]